MLSTIIDEIYIHVNIIEKQKGLADVIMDTRAVHVTMTTTVQCTMAI